MAPAPSWRRRAIIVVAMAIALLLGLVTVWRAGPYTHQGHTWGAHQDHSDYTVYLAAGHSVLAGTDIYKAHNDRGWAYVYPPPLAIVMAPLSLMPVPWAVFLGYLGAIVLMALAFRWCTWLADSGHMRAGPLIWLLPLLLVAPYLANGLFRGQASIPMAALVIGAVYYEARGFSMRGAVCLAGAILLKVFPVALLLYFAWRKRWRFCTWTVLACIVGGVLFPAAVFGMQQAIAYLVEWVHVVGQPSLATHAQRTSNPLYSQLLEWGNLHDQSLYAVLGRLASRTDTSLVPHIRAITAGVIAAMLVPLYAVSRQVRGQAGLYVVAAFIVWMLLASPITEKHYFTLLLLPFFIISFDALQGLCGNRGLARGLVAVFFASSIIATVPKEDVAVLWRYGWLCWSSMLLWAGLLALAVRNRATSVGNPLREPPGTGYPTAHRWRSVSLILPMYNESAAVDETLAEAVSQMRHDFDDFEIVVVDDASTDDCAERVTAWTLREPAIKLVRLPYNQRFGGALRTGLDAARGDVLIYTDFDLPIPLKCLPQTLSALSSADVLTGHSPQHSKHANYRSALVSLVYNTLVRTLFGLRLRDINFGFKVLTRNAWKSMATASHSPFIDAEILIQAQALGWRVEQVAVRFMPRRSGVSRMRRFAVIAATLADMARLLGRMSTGRIKARQAVRL